MESIRWRVWIIKWQFSLLTVLAANCSGFFSATASDVTDSLEALLPSAALSHRISILNQLAQEYSGSLPEKTEVYAKEALHLARDQKNLKEEAIAIYNLGLASFYTNRYDHALSLFQQGKNLATQAGDDKTLAMVYSMIGYYYELQSDFSVALAYYRNALSLRQKIGNYHGAAKSLDNIGNIYQYMGEYDAALQSYREAMGVYEIYPEKKGLSQVTNNMGIIYYYLSDYEKAIQLFQQSYHLKEELGDGKGMANSLNNIASIYQMMGNLEQALIYYEKTLNIQKERGFKLSIANTSINVGTVYTALKDYRKAREYYEEALNLYREVGNRKGIAVALSNLGDMEGFLNNPQSSMRFYREALEYQEQIQDKQEMVVTLRRIGDLLAAGKDYHQALSCLKRSYQMAQAISSQKEMMDAAFSLAEVYHQTGNNAMAFASLQEASAMRDSLFSKEKHLQITEMQTRFETREKDIEITALKQEKEIRELQLARHRLTVYVVVSILLVLTLAGLLFFSRFRNRQKQRQKDLELAKMDMEQRLLLTQINPHFLFNALGSVQGVIHASSKQEASDFVGKFARLMRMNLENSRNPSISLAEEALALQYYLDIEQRRFSGKFDYSVEIDDALDLEHTCFPPMLVQPIVENAILHGIRHLQQNGHIRLQFTAEDPFLLITVEDNGVGRAQAALFTAAENQSKKSLGTQLIRERLKLLSSPSQLGYSIDTEDLKDGNGQPAGTRVVLRIPLSDDSVHSKSRS